MVTFIYPNLITLITFKIYFSWRISEISPACIVLFVAHLLQELCRSLVADDILGSLSAHIGQFS